MSYYCFKCGEEITKLEGHVRPEGQYHPECCPMCNKQKAKKLEDSNEQG